MDIGSKGVYARRMCEGIIPYKVFTYGGRRFLGSRREFC